MEASTVNALIAGIVGLIAGLVGSLIAPWVQWGVEKKRIKQQRRIEMINQWREILSQENFQRTDFLNHPLYGPLRELIKQDVLKNFERPTLTFIGKSLDESPKDSYDRDIIMKEVARIEKEWGVI